jgi:hypothetical protein
MRKYILYLLVFLISFGSAIPVAKAGSVSVKSGFSVENIFKRKKKKTPKKRKTTKKKRKKNSNKKGNKKEQNTKNSQGGQKSQKTVTRKSVLPF